jgi:hypothetical protein
VPELLQCFEGELGAYHEKHGREFAVIKEKSKLRVDHMQVNKQSDIMHIEYIVPQGNVEEKREYAQFISNECWIRSIPLHDTLEDWRLSLYQSISLEEYITFLESIRQWDEEGRKTVVLVKVIELLIPCILHCKNRVGEKKLTILLWRQLDHFPGPKIDFIQRMDATFKTQILGTEISSAHWNIKHSKDNNGQIIIKPLQVRNQIAWKMISNIEKNVDAAVPIVDNEFGDKFILGVESYREVMSLLTMDRSLWRRRRDKLYPYSRLWSYTLLLGEV